MNKKAIAILGAIFILIVGTLGFLIFAKYGKKTAAPAATDTNSQPVVSNPPVTPAASSTPPTTAPPTALAKLLEGPVVSPALFYNGLGVTYFDPSGQLYQANTQTLNGQFQAASPQSLDIAIKSNISRVIWPPTGDDFIAEFAGSGQKTWSFYSSKARLYADLPAQVEALDWLPSGKQIYYIWLEGGKATLNVGDPDTQNWKFIANMWELDDALSVSPDGKNIIYYEQNTATSSNPINLTTPDGKIWKTLISTGVNYGALWSPDSQKFLFAKKDPTGTTFQLWYYNLLTGEVENLGFNTTPDKAVWSKNSDTIYLAEPISGQAGSGNLTKDRFYKDQIQARSNFLYVQDSAVDGENLFLSSDESRLFFKNAQDGGVYYLNLNQ